MPIPDSWPCSMEKQRGQVDVPRNHSFSHQSGHRSTFDFTRAREREVHGKRVNRLGEDLPAYVMRRTIERDKNNSAERWR